MKVLLIFVILLLVPVKDYPHGQQVHQYIVVEAYKLLKQNLGYGIPIFEDHIGGIGSDYQGDYAWQKHFITTGAYREDEEDVIFNYDVFVIPGINYALVSITHFWNADDGDLNKNIFSIKVDPFPAVNIGPYENAYDKFLRFANGGWTLWFPDVLECTDQITNHDLIITPIPALPPKRAGVSVSYSSIVDLYKTSKLNLELNQYSSFSVFDLNTQQIIPPESVTNIIINTSAKDRIVWEVLGKMCHLLGDMSVPAHTHNDEHGTLADSYENWMGGNENPYLVWNFQNAGDFINPFNSDNDPLHYLLYTLQQQTDHFGSNGPGSIGNGNDLIGGNPRSNETIFLSSANLSSIGEPTTSNGPWSNANLENIRENTFPFAIRATTGLLYWFAHELELTAVEEIMRTSENIVHYFELQQNYPNPFNPSTKIKYSLPQLSNVLIIVFDILGNEIEIIVNEEKPSGTYELTWTAANLPNGVYFYQLKAADFIQTKKMILLK